MSNVLKIWDCKIGEIDKDKLPVWADVPMRQAVEKKYLEITGEDPVFCFSGWGGELTEHERNIVHGTGNIVDIMKRERQRENGPELYQALKYVEQFIDEIDENHMWWKLNSKTNVSEMVERVRSAINKTERY